MNTKAATTLLRPLGPWFPFTLRGTLPVPGESPSEVAFGMLVGTIGSAAVDAREGTVRDATALVAPAATARWPT
jgi:hypothetical protein